MKKRSLNDMNNFSKESIDSLVDLGVTMQYARFRSHWGLWIPDELLVKISRQHQSSIEEDVTILHEWLHAYEDLILYSNHHFDITVASRSPDVIIDEYAKWHYQRDPALTQYIRRLFTDEGF